MQTNTTDTQNTGDTRSITMEFDLPHPLEKVWRALTERELLEKWLMTTNIELAVGQRFTFKTQPMQGWDGVVNCEMKEIEPLKRLRYSWASLGLDTVITWTLTPTPKGGTLLRLEQSGFPTEKGKLPFFEGAKAGWQNMAGQRLPEVLGALP
jgi:uncharacterized protein YndB with AHSA1/START domain